MGWPLLTGGGIFLLSGQKPHSTQGKAPRLYLRDVLIPVFVFQFCNELSLLLVGIEVEAQVGRRTGLQGGRESESDVLIYVHPRHYNEPDFKNRQPPVCKVQPGESWWVPTVVRAAASVTSPHRPLCVGVSCLLPPALTTGHHSICCLFFVLSRNSSQWNHTRDSQVSEAETAAPPSLRLGSVLLSSSGPSQSRLL